MPVHSGRRFSRATASMAAGDQAIDPRRRRLAPPRPPPLPSLPSLVSKEATPSPPSRSSSPPLPPSVSRPSPLRPLAPLRPFSPASPNGKKMFTPMAFVVVKQRDTFTLIREKEIIRGPRFPGFPVKFRVEGQNEEAGTFSFKGTKKDCMAFMANPEDEGVRGRKKKKGKNPFTTFHPNVKRERGGDVDLMTEGDEDEEGEEEEEEEEEEWVERRTGQQAGSRVPAVPRRSDIDHNIDVSREPTMSPSASIRHSSPVTSTLGDRRMREIVRDVVREETSSLHNKMDRILSFMERHESRYINDRGLMQSISDSVTERDQTGEALKKSVKDLAKDVATAVRNLPSASIAFDYNEYGMSRARVDLMDGPTVNYIRFAARISDRLFADQLHLPIEDRDPHRLVWLQECLSQRRKFSAAQDQLTNWKQALKRINQNHRTHLARLARPVVVRNHRGGGGKFVPKAKPGGINGTPRASPYGHPVSRMAHIPSLQTPRSHKANHSFDDFSMATVSTGQPTMRNRFTMEEEEEEEYEMEEEEVEEEYDEISDFEDQPFESQYNKDAQYSYM